MEVWAITDTDIPLWSNKSQVLVFMFIKWLIVLPSEKTENNRIVIKPVKPIIIFVNFTSTSFMYLESTLAIP